MLKRRSMKWTTAQRVQSAYGIFNWSGDFVNNRRAHRGLLRRRQQSAVSLPASTRGITQSHRPSFSVTLADVERTGTAHRTLRGNASVCAACLM
jgi:hypothetical protein